MSYTYLQEQGEVSSAASFSDIPLSVLLKLNLTPEKSYSKDNETESCHISQYGTTSELWKLMGNGYGFLPRPQASDGQKFYALTRDGALKRKKSGRQIMMVHAVGLTAYMHLNKWRENPVFWEAAMGWPIRWTDLKPLEMVKFQEWLNLHGKRSHAE